MLDRETARRRVIAARVLAGLSREELAQAMVARGWGSEDVNRLEREAGKKGGDNSKPPPRLDQRASHLAEITGLPDKWFTEPDYGRLFKTTPEQSLANELRQEFQEQLVALEDRILARWEREELESDLESAAQQSDSNGKRTEEPEPASQNE